MREPEIKEFVDLNELNQPDDGVLYKYRSSDVGFWYITQHFWMAIEDATGYTPGELEKMEDRTEEGEIRAIYVEENKGSGDIEYDGYPDFVLQSKCKECSSVFYSRRDASFCPHCGEEDPLSQGNGVVCHKPPE